ncbi:hypothetical protein Pmar_PMAR008914 [Perkinsus marinus ATCC 50983]|uniref:Uncharacterized protein n=1 Tax=Perkinsus marinus (strain ATCC 50983 / TXsc) TaxID=423536 RepID=C5KAC3_PERM5|nr:hypothetical protein Pmar_PMAR008914 [Perkinsus marinus ATCC 50983]EER18584.1 hypothetical protein Pmar_PMAR008914 [Perkinsus marinus ATCC 50983]|eukprot:XP_002786788.1 hypothetical protein Pmar_PMAR008914 [Perkinsus marinus ATCC 50983]
MAKRRAAEQLVMAQVKSYAQRCRTRAKLYCVGDQHSATHKRNGIWDTAEGVW